MVLVWVMIITDLETLLLLLQLLQLLLLPLLPLLLSVSTLPYEVCPPSARCAPSIR